MTSPAKPYRRRPLQVEAVQLTADADWEAIAQWCGGEIQVVRAGHCGSDPERCGKGDDAFRRIEFTERGPGSPYDSAATDMWIVKYEPEIGFRRMYDFPFQSEFEPDADHTDLFGAATTDAMQRKFDDAYDSAYSEVKGAQDA